MKRFLTLLLVAVLPLCLMAQDPNNKPKKPDFKKKTEQKQQPVKKQQPTKKDKTTKKQGLSATIEKVWIDHNTTWNGMKGMTIHTKLTLHGVMEKFHMGITHYFEYADGRPLWGDTNHYRSTDPNGNPQVTAWCDGDVTPESSEMVIQDWWRFIPYSALHLEHGKHHLKIWTFIRNDTVRKTIHEEAICTYFDYDAGD